MKIKDLTPYVYSNNIKGLKGGISVGWIEGDDLFHNSGKVSPEVIRLLKEYEIHNRRKGVHMCEYCSEWSNKIANGNGEIWVVKGETLYIAPYLIIHYIEEHNYQPPEEFIDAVINGFRPDSLGYEMKLGKILNK